MSNSKYIKRITHSITRILLVIGVMFCVLESYAQQDPMYTQYMENLLTLNPAYAGSKDVLSMMVVSRNQWVSMPGAPVTRSFSMNSPVAGTKMGLGFSFLSDQVDPVKQTGVYIDYSFTLSFSRRRSLSLGLKGGVNFFEAGLSDLTTNDPDPIFANDINRKFLPNFGVGAFYYTPKSYFGLSLPKLIENRINKNGVFHAEYQQGTDTHFFYGGLCI